MPGTVGRHLLDAGGDAPHCLDLRLRGFSSPLLCGRCPLPFPSPPAPGLRPPCLRWPAFPPPLLAPGCLPAPGPVAPARPLPPAALPMSLTVPRIPSASARALVFPVRLPPPRCRLCLCPSRAPAPVRCCSRPDLSLVPAPPGCLLSLCRSLALALLLRLVPPFYGCLPSPALYLCTLPLAPSHRCLLRVQPPLVLCLDHATMQLQQRDVHRRAFGRGGGNGPWPPFGECGLGRVRLGEAHVGVAGLDLQALLGALAALRCGCRGPGRLAQRADLGPRWAGPARRRRTWGRGAVRWGGGSGPLRLVRRHVPGPTCGRCGGGNSLGGGGGPPGWHRFGARQIGVAWGCLGPPSLRPDRNCGLRQPPLLPLCRGLSRASWGDGVAGAGPAVVAVVPLGGGIRVCHCSYPVRHAWLQARLSYVSLHNHIRVIN